MVLLAVAMRVVVPPLRRALETSARYFPVASQRDQEHWCKHLVCHLGARSHFLRRKRFPTEPLSH